MAATLAASAQTLPEQRVTPHAVDVVFSAEALVEAVRQATVAAQVSGRVVEMRVDAGQTVKKGEVLLRIDAGEAGEAVAAAAAQQINAKVSYRRQQSLRQQGFISQAALDKAKADFDSAQAAYGQASVGLGHATVRAPIDGVVAQRLTELGEMATPGKPLLALYDPRGLRVTASIPQYRLAQIRTVRQARVEFPEPGKWVEATGVAVLPTADPATHVSPVRLGLPAGLGGVLPGMHARAHFVVGRAEKLTVPRAAVVRRGEVSAVYVRDEQDRSTLRQLRLGEPLGADQIEVLAGLRGGERVLLDPLQAAAQLKAGKPLAN